MSNPRTRIPPRTLPKKNSRCPLTPKIMLLMTLTSRIVSLLRVFSLTIHGKEAKCLEGCSQSKTSFTFSFNQVHKTMHMNSFNSSFRHTSAFRGLSFSFVAYGSDLLVKVWFVFIVLVLEVTSRIASVLHVFSLKIFTKADQNL